ncbi:spore protease YyaC [Anaeroselena agilis]|uniref:Spore protease YyaC n=1 Tax=Anaeroselena agilis TaxID=3063788 RepID=A0ABU3P2R1_9FIRM|nr:spore protease YyaC [Selenomonadales bacterium 4137-cl]
MLNRIFNVPSPDCERRFSISSPLARQDLAASVRAALVEAGASGRPVVILCIGTDRSTGDALGPLTGSRLRTLYTYPHIFGTLDDPVHATNLADSLQSISKVFSNPYIVAVDACLGRLESVGCVTVGRGPLRPGAAVNKDLPPVGDICITGIVNVGGFMEHLVLQSTRLNLVMKMADAIAFGLATGLYDYEKGISSC